MDVSRAARILIVDDNPAIPSSVAQGLNHNGYEVLVARNPNDALQQICAVHPDLIMVQTSPSHNGSWHLIGHLRERFDLPLIVLTTTDDEDCLVHAFDQGADDYVVTPVGLPELKARIRAALRHAAMPPVAPDYTLRFGGDRLVIDPASRRVTASGERVHLTPTEYRLLLYLAYNAGRTLTLDQILDAVWGPGYETSQTSVKVYVRRLRLKIESEPRHPALLLTQRGAGYYLAHP